MSKIDSSHNRRLVVRYVQQKGKEGIMQQTEVNQIVNTINVGSKDERTKIIREMLKKINGEKMEAKNGKSVENSKTEQKKVSKPKTELGNEKTVPTELIREKYEKKLKQVERLKKIVEIVKARIEHAEKMKQKAIKETELFGARLQKAQQKVEELQQKLNQTESK